MTNVNNKLDWGEICKLPDSSNIKIIRSGDRTIEFQIVKQALDHSNSLDKNIKVTKTVRVELPKCTRSNIHKYKKIVNYIYTKANQLAESKNHELTEKDLMKIIVKGKKTGYKWKLTSERTGLFKLVLKFLNWLGICKMFHLHKKKGVIELKLKQNTSLFQFLMRIFRSRRRALKHFHTFVKLPVENYSPSQSISPNTSSFSDPFTKIAKYAFKNLESDYIGHDYSSKKQIVSDYVVTLNDGQLTLVHKSDVKPSINDSINAAAEEYKKHLIQEYGEDKVAYMAHGAGIDFENLAKLTPEHIYRMNILACNLESHDIDELLAKMVGLKALLPNEIDNNDFIDLLKTDNTLDFSNYQIKNILKFVRAEQNLSEDSVVTIDDFKKTVDGLNIKSTDNVINYIIDTPSEKLNSLMMAVMPTKEERHRAYTGRKIYRPIDSAYTTADLKFWKPWIDQQEVLQTFDNLEDDTIHDLYDGSTRTLTQEEKNKRFDELAVFIFCKKHLFREHPTEDYRVGAIIPGPSGENGEKRWYRVDRMASNNEGLLFYVLEPVGKNSGLETYLVARSTASNEYAYNSEGTILNDFNPINAPGYLGRRHIESGLRDVRKNHTIPLWVAYQHSASTELKKADVDIEKVRSQLNKSKECFFEKTLAEHGVKSLHDIIQKYDAEFLDLVWKSSDKFTLYKIFMTLAKTERGKFENILIHFGHDFSKQRIAGEFKGNRMDRIKEEKQAVEFLIDYINKHGKKDGKNGLDIRQQQLINALKDNIAEVSPDKSDKNSVIELHVPENIKHAFEILADPNSSLKQLKEVEKVLHDYSVAQGEDVASKQTNGLRIAGHSLGGSTAEVEAAYLLGESKRIPVPGAKVNCRLYDDPGLNEEDNIELYDMLFDHQAVMRELDSQFEVYHSHEYGDFIPMGGTAHLGGLTPRIKRGVEIKVRKALAQDVDSGKLLDEFKTWLRSEKRYDAAFFEGNDTLITLFTENPKAKQEIIKFFYRDFDQQNTFQTVIRSTSKNALEPETGSVDFKHGTRFESAKREKTEILKIARQVNRQLGKSKLKVSFRTLGNYIKESQSLDKTNPDYQQFIRQFDLYESLKIKTRDNIEVESTDISSLEEVFPRIYSKLMKKRKGNIVINNKVLRSLEREINRNHKKLLSTAKKEYTKVLSRQCKDSYKNGVGGFRSRYLSSEILGAASGRGHLSKKVVRKIWGVGVFNTDFFRWLVRLLALTIFPALKKASLTQERREEFLKGVGHEMAERCWNPDTRALMVGREGAFYEELRV
ncbi:MAG: hypothetical protein VX777_00665 [Chlamydiota bacterium]|nr:hypothetical protein [Chlamydiota bacterium]